MRWWVPIAVFGMMLAGRVAGAAETGTPYGLLRGVVTLEDGAPYALSTVTYTAAGSEPVTVETGYDGAFGGLVPAGPVTATVTGVVGATATATVVPGEVCSLVVPVKLPGILLTVDLPDGKPATYAYVTAAYESPDGAANTIPGTSVGAGRFWINNIPPNTTNLAVIARYAGGATVQVTRKEFAFTTHAERRLLTLTMPKLTPVAFTIADVTGASLPRVKVTGKIVYFTPAYDDWYPEGKDPDTEALAAGQRTVVELKPLYANAFGTVQLGEWPTGRYIARLVIGGEAQPDVPFTIGKTGPSITRVQLAGTYRTVRQTAFDAFGHPVPNAEVYATYCWLGKAVLTHNTADAAGVVTWKNLPPARAIVWGPRVAAGVLPADADTADAPLPAPVPDTARAMRFYLLNPGDQAVHFSWLLWKSDKPGDPDDVQEQDYVPLTYAQAATGVRDTSYWEVQLQGGAPFHLLVVAGTRPLWMTALTEVYAPYSETDEPPVFDLVLNEGAFLHGRFTTVSGKPALVTQLRAEALGDLTLPPVLTDELARKLGHEAVTERPDGTYDVSFLSPGQYRFTADLFDHNVPPPPGMAVTVAQGENTADVTLPESLLTAPGGVTVCWATRAAPLTVRRLALPAGPTPLPLFGPAERVLALWYAPSPTSLTIATPGAGPARTLALRHVSVQPRDAAGKPVTDPVHLLPLLPMPADQRFFYQLPSEGHAEASNTLLRKDGTYDAYLWPGTYPLVDDALQGRRGTLTVPEAGAATLPVTVRRAESGLKTLTLTFANLGQAPQRHNSAPVISLRADVPLPEPALLHPDDIVKGVATVQVPAAARTLSLQWLGAGVIDTVALPAADGAVTLPAWSPGLTITGTVLRETGAPYADGDLLVGPHGSLAADNVSLTTDDDGKFTLTGALPGPCFAYAVGDALTAGWSFTVAGKTAVTLHMTEAPVTFALPEELGDAQRLWWIPAVGKPLPLPPCGRRGGNIDTGGDTWKQCNSFDVVPGPGWLWAVDGRYGRGLYVALNAQPNWNQLAKSDGPTLALYAPLDAGVGAVTLVGDGPRAGLTATFPTCFWQPLPLLNTTVAQLDAVPPGPYHVTVELKTGRVTLPVTVTAYGAVATVGAHQYPRPGCEAQPGREPMSGPAPYRPAIDGGRKRPQRMELIAFPLLRRLASTRMGTVEAVGQV